MLRRALRHMCVAIAEMLSIKVGSLEPNAVRTLALADGLRYGE